MAKETLQSLLTKIKAENNSSFLALITKINEDKLETHQITRILKELPARDVAAFTSNQMILLRTMQFRGGNSMYFYTNRADKSYFEGAYDKVQRDWALFDDLLTIPKEDLIYLSDYHKSKWRKDNPSRTNTKGTQFTFKMDMFSLTLFKNSIKKGFLRTEAKNFVTKVNQAFSNSPKELSHIKVRNKFYALILDNTAVHTKAMLNILVETPIKPRNGNYYLPDEDEALYVYIGYGGNTLASFNTSDSMNTYSSDLKLVTHNNGIEGDRENNRLAAAGSMLLTAYANTSHEPYKTLATRMLAGLDTTTKVAVLDKTKAIEELRTILKESNE